MANSPAPNRNVVSRRLATKPRVEARTTEIDCSQFAKLLEQEAVSPVVDLDAEIEVVSTTSTSVDASARNAPRFAHTRARASEPVIPRTTAEIPRIALEALTAQPEPMPALPVPPMIVPAMYAPTFEPEPELAPARSRGWIVFAAASVAVALIGLIAVVRL